MEKTQKLVEEQPLHPHQTDLDRDKGDDIVDELLVFAKESSEISWSLRIKMYFEILYDTLALVVPFSGNVFVNCAGLILMDQIGDTSSQAALGISEHIYLIFYMGLFMPLYEKMGIDLSVSFGEKNYQHNKVIFWKGVLVSSVSFLCYSFPIFFFSGDALFFVGLEREEAAKTQYIMNWMIPMAIIEGASNLIKSNCMAQGLEKVYALPYSILVAVALIFSWVFVVEFEMGLTGWLLAKLLYHFETLAFDLYTLLKLAHPKTVGIVSLSEVREDFGTFFCQSMKFGFSTSLEYFAYETAGMVIVSGGNPNVIAAFSSVGTIALFIFNFGESFAIIGRTRMNILIGRKMNETAKQFFSFFIKCAFFTGVLFSLICSIFKGVLIRVFANNNEELMDRYTTFLFIYCLYMPIEMIIPTSFIGIKTIGKVQILLLSNLGFLVWAVFVVGLILGVIVKVDPYVLYSVNLSFSFIQVVCSVVYVMTRDWTSMELHLDEDDEVNEKSASKHSISNMRNGLNTMKIGSFSSRSIAKNYSRREIPKFISNREIEMNKIGNKIGRGKATHTENFRPIKHNYE